MNETCQFIIDEPSTVGVLNERPTTCNRPAVHRHGHDEVDGYVWCCGDEEHCPDANKA